MASLILHLRKIFFLFFGLVCINVQAAELAEPKFEVYRIVGDQRKKINSISGQAKWYWEKVGDGALALRIKANFSIPSVLSSAVVSTANSSVRAKIEGQKLTLVTSDMLSVLSFTKSPAERMQFEFKVDRVGMGIYEEDCKEIGLESRIDSKEIPFFVGLRCQSNAQGTQLWMTIPAEASIERSSVHDTQGKGENWKVYELGNVDAAKGEIASFRIRFLNKNYNLNITSIKIDEAKRKGKEAKFALGLGYDSMKFEGSIGKFSDSKPVFILKGLPYSLFWRIGMGIDLTVALAFVKNDNSISYLQILPFGYLRFVERPGFLLEGRGYFSITNQAHASSGGGYQTNQIGAGTRLGFRAYEPWWVYLEARQDGIGTDAIRSHIFGDLLVLRRSKNKDRLVWGGGLQYQEIKVDETSLAQEKFGQSLIYLMAEF